MCERERGAKACFGRCRRGRAQPTMLHIQMMRTPMPLVYPCSSRYLADAQQPEPMLVYKVHTYMCRFHSVALILRVKKCMASLACLACLTCLTCSDIILRTVHLTFGHIQEVFVFFAAQRYKPTSRSVGKRTKAPYPRTHTWPRTTMNFAVTHATKHVHLRNGFQAVC